MKVTGVKKEGGGVKFNECQKQHTDKNNANGKRPAVIENNMGKSQQRVCE